MAQLAFYRGEPALVSRDRPTGGWRHRYYKGGTFVSPSPRGAPWKVAEKNTADLFCYAYTPGAGDVIVELGAEFGTETVFLSRMVGPGGRVLAVEAHPWTYELLRRTVVANRLANVQVARLAVMGSDGSASITGGPGGSSLESSAVAGTGTIAVSAVSLPTLLARYGIGHVDLLKVNIEGAEREVIVEGASALDKVRHAVVSCHDFRAELGDGEAFRTAAEVESALRGRGFAVTGRPDDPRPWVRHYKYATR